MSENQWMNFCSYIKCTFLIWKELLGVKINECHFTAIWNALFHFASPSYEGKSQVLWPQGAMAQISYLHLRFNQLMPQLAVAYIRSSTAGFPTFNAIDTFLVSLEGAVIWTRGGHYFYVSYTCLVYMTWKLINYDWHFFVTIFELQI